MNVLLLGPLWRNEPIKRFLEEHGNTVVAYNDEINTELVEQHAIDIILSSGYGPIIKEPIVSRYHNKIYNLHATYLPYGKGIGTTFFSVFEGSPTGVSIHYIDAYIDTGDILFRRAVEYTTDDTLRTFYHTLLAETEKLFIEHWNEIADRDYTPMQQETLGIEVPSAAAWIRSVLWICCQLSGILPLMKSRRWVLISCWGRISGIGMMRKFLEAATSCPSSAAEF